MAWFSGSKLLVIAAVAAAAVAATISVLGPSASAGPAWSACRPIHVFSQPPAGFDPATATDAQLARYGFPPRPPGASNSAAYQAWLRAVEGTTFVAPHPVCSNRTHASATDDGSVIGGIYLMGGPASGRPQPPQAGEVSVFAANGHLVTHEHVRSGRRFRFKLAPVSYWLNAGWRLHPRRLAPYYDCEPVKTRVHADRTAQVKVGFGCYWK